MGRCRPVNRCSNNNKPFLCTLICLATSTLPFTKTIGGLLTHNCYCHYTDQETGTHLAYKWQSSWQNPSFWACTNPSIHLSNIPMCQALCMPDSCTSNQNATESVLWQPCRRAATCAQRWDHCISLADAEKIIFNLIIKEEHNTHGENNLYYWCLFG